MNIDGQVIYSGEMVCGGIYYLPITINYNYYISSTNESNNKIVSLRTCINGNVNAKFYDSNDVVPPSFIEI